MYRMERRERIPGARVEMNRGKAARRCRTAALHTTRRQLYRIRQRGRVVGKKEERERRARFSSQPRETHNAPPCVFHAATPHLTSSTRGFDESSYPTFPWHATLHLSRLVNRASSHPIMHLSHQCQPLFPNTVENMDDRLGSLPSRRTLPELSKSQASSTFSRPSPNPNPNSVSPRSVQTSRSPKELSYFQHNPQKNKLPKHDKDLHRADSPIPSPSRGLQPATPEKPPNSPSPLPHPNPGTPATSRPESSTENPEKQMLAKPMRRPW